MNTYLLIIILLCSDETILYKVIWSNDENLFAMWMNRFQNESHLVHYHVTDDTVKVKEVSVSIIFGVFIYFI